MNAINDNCHRVILLLALTALWLLLTGTEVFAAQIPLKSIAQLTADDDGRSLNYPSTVFYDAVEEEIYLVNGGTGRVVVYGPDFFPEVSIGVGRGVEAPRGGVVLENGEVYLLQVHNVNSKRPRITILNGAFFVEREIFLDVIPEAAGLSPRELAVSRDGLIYLAGSSSRGVLVLDNDGNFLRRLQPLDQTLAKVSEDELETSTESSGEEQLKAAAEEMADTAPDIPEEYLPRGAEQGDSAAPRKGLSPVRIGHVTIDSKGRIYLLSGETSKIYVYGPDESFLYSFGKKGGTPRYLSQPRALAIDEKRGMVYVADFMRHSILAYDMKGEYKFEFGGRGAGAGWFNFPEDMTINNQGQLIVADLFNRRVQVLEVDYENFPPSLKAQLGGAVEVGEEALKDEALKDETVTEETVTEETVTGEAVIEEAVIEETVTEETVTEETVTEETVTEETVIPEAESSGAEDHSQ